MRFAGSVAPAARSAKVKRLLPGIGRGEQNGGMKPVVLAATVGNIVVAGATYAYYGWNAVGTDIGARNTARFSALIFIIALAAHHHSRFGRDYVPLIKAFVAAHVVHFGTVIAYHLVLGKLSNPMFLAAASAGAILLTATALTITKAPRAHVGLTYVVWLAFMIAFGSNLTKRTLPEGPLMALLALAMLIHLVNVFRMRKISASAASA